VKAEFKVVAAAKEAEEILVGQQFTIPFIDIKTMKLLEDSFFGKYLPEFKGLSLTGFNLFFKSLPKSYKVMNFAKYYEILKPITGVIIFKKEETLSSHQIHKTYSLTEEDNLIF